MKTFIIALAILIFSQTYANPKEIHIKEIFDCDFNELMHSEEEESLTYYEGEVSQITDDKAVVSVYENGKHISIILPAVCNNSLCLKEGEYVKIFVKPHSHKCCIKVMEEEK